MPLKEIRAFVKRAREAARCKLSSCDFHIIDARAWFARLGSENCANAEEDDDLDALPPSRITFHNFQLHETASIVPRMEAKRALAEPFPVERSENLSQIPTPPPPFLPHICLSLASAQTNRFASCLECQYHCWTGEGKISIKPIWNLFKEFLLSYPVPAPWQYLRCLLRKIYWATFYWRYARVGSWTDIIASLPGFIDPSLNWFCD